MRTRDLLLLVRFAFVQNRMRAVLTLLGIVIGAGAIVMLASLLKAGEDALLRTSQQANESDMIEIYNRPPPQEDRNKTTRPLSTYDADALSASPVLGGQANVTAAPQQRMRAVLGDEELYVTAFGAAEDALSLYRLELMAGRFVSANDLQHKRRVAVVGQEVYLKLLKPRIDERLPGLDTTDEAAMRDALKDVQLTVGGVVFSVVGVLAHKPTMGGGSGAWMWNRRVLVPRTTFISTYSPNKSVRSVFVRLKDAGALSARVQIVADVVEQTLLRRHYGVKNFRREGDGANDQGQLVLDIIKLLLLGTGLVALFVGGTNIMNIMLVTVTERTREIGVRMAVGAKRVHVLLQFLLEAMALGLVGGLLGVFGGLGMAWVLSLVLTQVLGHWPFYVEWWSVGLGLLLSVTTGAVFGVLPAWRAARLDPVAALRSDG